MASSLPLVAPRVFILRIKIHCSKCENKMKRFLERSPGVRSATIDAKEGTVAISATVEPSRIIMLLEQGLGLKAELLWDQNPSSMAADGQDWQIVADSKFVDHDQRFEDPNVVAQLKQLSEIKGLKTVEFTYSKTIKVTVKGQNGDLSDKNNVEVVVKDEVHSPKIYHSGGGGVCGASASCCGGHRHVMNQTMNNLHAPGYPVCSNVCAMHSCFNNQYGNMQGPPQACGCVPPPGPPPPWSGAYRPSAPPVETGGNYYSDAPRCPPPPPPPPARDSSFFNQFNDENTSSSCNIM